MIDDFPNYKVTATGTTALEDLHAIPDWERQLAEYCAATEYAGTPLTTPEQVLAKIAEYDANGFGAKDADSRHGAMASFDSFESWETTTDLERGRTKERCVSYEGEPEGPAADLERLIRHVEMELHRRKYNQRASAAGLEPMLLPWELAEQRAKPLSTSKEAIRKRRARAAGRVKARPKKGPPSLAQRIASAQKGLETRRAKLAELQSKLDDPAHKGVWTSISNAIARTEASIRRTEATIATFRRRQAAQHG